MLGVFEVLPQTMSNEPNATYARLENKSNADHFNKILQQLSHHSFDTDRRNPFHVQLQETITENNVSLWLQLDEQKAFQEYLVRNDINRTDNIEHQNEDYAAENKDNKDESEDKIRQLFLLEISSMHQQNQIEKQH